VQDNYFLYNLIFFTRMLRELGMSVSPEQTRDLAQVLTRIGIARRQDVHNAARSILVHKHSDLALFDRAFDLFFAIQGKPQQSIIDPAQAPVARGLKPKTIQQLAEEGKQTDPRTGSQPAPESDELPFYSANEIFKTKRFDQFTDEELRSARRFIEQMNWRVGLRRTRRHKRIPRGARLDLSRVLRKNLKYGAEVYDLPARRRKFKPRPLVILADISGSMERYSRMVLHLVHALSAADVASHVEAFVFSTRLTRITNDLKRKSVDAALARVSAHTRDFGGGTRIGEALKTFNYKWARRVLRNGAVVLIISDGWDCGNLELLRDEMARLQRNSSRLIWLNPLLRDASFQAEAQGLRVALPFVDDHLSVQNLASIEQLVQVLSTLGESRPLRRQLPRVEIPENKDSGQKFMQLPQLATSDYVRKTMVLKTVNGVPTFVYEDNPGDIM
jgi:uncharacterized protein with von Willebrand factor type A (vWA) domain